MKRNWKFITNCLSIVVFINCLFSTVDVSAQDIKVSILSKSQDSLVFQEIEGNVLSLGISPDYCFGKVEISNLNLNVGIFTVYIDNSLLDEVTVYRDNNFSSVIFKGGELFPSESDNTGYSFQLPNLDGKSVFYFKARSDEQLIMPIQIYYDYLDFIKQEIDKRAFYFFYLGVMIVMILYNIFIFISVKDKTYLKYVFYVGTVMLTQLVISGYADQYLWKGMGETSRIMSSIVPILSGIGTLIFSMDFIRTKYYAPKFHKLLNVFFALYVLSAILVFVNAAYWSQLIINFNASCALILVPVSIIAIRAGYRPAKYYLIAWSFFLFGVTIYALRNLGIIEYSVFSNYSLPVGSAIEAILLSLALADRINILKKENEIAQGQAMSMMQENQRLINEQNSILEKQVEERTKELKNTNLHLEQTLSNLQLTQKQLVESEKLASLGQMTAGIAHEINNPVNFVRSNVQPLKRDIDEIMMVLQEVNPALDIQDLSSHWLLLQQKYKALDVDYLKQEIVQLLNGIDEGSRRTADIVKSLRVFSRMDHDALVSADINECILSTLMVMKNITSKECTVNTHLDDQLPPMMCYAGKLNQVLMNLISNAIHATKMEDRSPKDRCIDIYSSQSSDAIIIQIKDNGTGMNEEVRKKIFDPFFTTKQVGEGTGLGLSIVMGIVQEHGGKIDVDSKWGYGTTFQITLPKNNPNVA
jgi:signal transduction histidine kinase